MTFNFTGEPDTDYILKFSDNGSNGHHGGIDDLKFGEIPADTVSQWSDKSQNANHATQTTESSKPKTNTRTCNNLNVLDFSDDYLVSPININRSTMPELSVFAVFAIKSTSAMDFYSVRTTVVGIGLLLSKGQIMQALNGVLQMQVAP